MSKSRSFRDDEQAKILSAVRSGSIENLDRLVLDKVDLNLGTIDGRSILHYAAANNMVNIVDYLLKGSHFNIDAKDNYCQTPLHVAASYGHTELVKLLIAKKANLTIQDEDGNTPLHLAVWSGQANLIEFLLDQMTERKQDNIYTAQNFDGNTPLHIAIIKHKDSKRAYLDKDYNQLIALKEFINIKNCLGQTPLHLSVLYNNDLKLIKLLVGDDPYNINIQNSGGNTILHLAVFQEDEKLVYELTENYQSLINVQNNEGRTALHESARKGSFNLFKILCEAKGNDISLKDYNNATLLHFIAYGGNKLFWDSLVKSDSDFIKQHINAVDNEENNLWHYLAMGSHNLSLANQYETASFLRENDVDKVILKKNNYENTVIDVLIEHNNWAATPANIHDKVQILPYYDKAVYLWDTPYSYRGWNEAKYAYDIKSIREKLIYAAIKGRNLEFLKLVEHYAYSSDRQEFQKQTGKFLLSSAEYGDKNIFDHFCLLNKPNKIGNSDSNGQNILHKAVMSGNIELIKHILNDNDSYLNIYIKDNSGRTPIHIAAEYGYLEIVRYFLEGPIIKAYTFNCTRFQVGSNEVKIEYTNYGALLKVNNEKARQDFDKKFASNNYFIAGLRYVVKYPEVIKDGTKVNLGEDVNGLYFIVSNIKVYLTNLSIKYIQVDSHKIKPNVWKEDYSYYLIYDELYKIQHSQIKITKINLNSFVDGSNNTLLHIAAKNNHYSVINYLINNKAEIEVRNLEQKNILETVAESGNAELFILMLENYDQIAKNRYKELRLKEEEYTEEEKVELKKQLQKTKEFQDSQRLELIENKESNNDDLLGLAVNGNNIDLVKFVLNKLKFDINSSSTSILPLELAILNGAPRQLIWYLIKHGAKVSHIYEALLNKICCIEDMQLIDCLMNEYEEILQSSSLLPELAIKNNNLELLDYIFKFHKNMINLRKVIPALVVKLKDFSHAKIIQSTTLIQNLIVEGAVTDKAACAALHGTKEITTRIGVSNYIKVLELLIKPENVNLQDEKGHTILHLLMKNLEIFSEELFNNGLLERIVKEMNGNLSVKDKEGFRPFDYVSPSFVMPLLEYITNIKVLPGNVNYNRFKLYNFNTPGEDFTHIVELNKTISEAGDSFGYMELCHSLLRYNNAQCYFLNLISHNAQLSSSQQLKEFISKQEYINQERINEILSVALVADCVSQRERITEQATREVTTFSLFGLRSSVITTSYLQENKELQLIFKNRLKSKYYETPVINNQHINSDLVENYKQVLGNTLYTEYFDQDNILKIEGIVPLLGDF